jgi:hypothetical protein
MSECIKAYAALSVQSGCGRTWRDDVTYPPDAVVSFDYISIGNMAHGGFYTMVGFGKVMGWL